MRARNAFLTQTDTQLPSFRTSLIAKQPISGDILVRLATAVLLTSLACIPRDGTDSQIGLPGQNGHSADSEPDAAQSKLKEPEKPAHLLTCVAKNELMLVSFPNTGAKNQNPSIRSVGRIEDKYGFQSVGAYRGNLICRVRGQLHAIDLNSGIARVLVSEAVQAAVLSADQLYFVSLTTASDKADARFKLVHLDLPTLKRTNLCKLENGASSSYAVGWRTDFSLAVSPNGRIAAITESRASAELGRNSRACRVVLAGPNSQVRRSEFRFLNLVVASGAGTYGRAPRVGWADNETVVIADHSSTGNPEFAMMGMPIAMLLRAMKTPTLAVRDVLELPETSSPSFKHAGNAPLVIDLGHQGPFLIDLKQNRLKEYRALGAGYQLQGRSLLFNGQLIEANTSSSRVFSSGKGRIAWLPNDNDPVTRKPSEGTAVGELPLQFHDDAQGQRQVFTKRFQRFVSSHQFPAHYLCVWISEENHQRTKAFDQLPIYEPPKPRTNVDTRPALSESISVEIQTDKPTYRRHEPVVATISVTNLSDKLVRFETKNLLAGAKPFDLEVRAERSRSKIDLYDDNRNKPDSEFLDLLPGKASLVACEFETRDTGSHELKLRFQHSRWSGRRIQVTAKFELLNEFLRQELKSKFDRLIASSVKRSEQGVNRFSGREFEQLGPEGVPLLINYLRQCSDDRLRAELGRGLEFNGTSDTLQYVKDLLDTGLNRSEESNTFGVESAAIRLTEAQTVASCLRGLCAYHSRDVSDLAKDSRKTLADIATSENPELRRAIVSVFSGVVHEDVDQLMIRAASDSDAAVADTAARYVAYRQQLSLRDWFVWAKENPSDASLKAGRSITSQLEITWKVDLGALPDSASRIRSSEADEKQWNQTLGKWIKWCDNNTLISISFFDSDREKAERFQHAFKYWGNDGGPLPIQMLEK